ncbi:AAA family ATPase [Yersinia aleksiciae]|uniref:AAA family ATPase n=1 Tax=Yersinia aleksiciae TaxID=263819 RepID=UPI00119E460C|nr:AAA family ATPase [Yersinia aleksiciae]
MLTEFYVLGLFGERDVRIDFSEPYKIIVAENGYGKTTILNLLYATLFGDLIKLRKLSFEELGVVFSSGEKISLKKDELKPVFKGQKDSPLFDYLEGHLGESFIFELIDDVRRYPFNRMELSSYFRKAVDALNIPNDVLREFLRGTRHGNFRKITNGKTEQKLDSIRKLFPFNQLYLPTYRRVEEDIKSLGVDVEVKSLRYSSINFGMDDVKESITKITGEILSSSIEWFSKINGAMLSQLVNGFSVTNDMKESISDPKAVRIVLDRIGEHITPHEKHKILSLVESGEIINNHEPLVYFVANLLKVYKQQQINDSAIQSFVSVSNKYLRDKEFIYNESNVTIEIVRKKNSNPVDIDTLSSGEKQIISLFAMLYLKNDTNLAIFFDEPELSLSMEWQKTLLPDIVNSGKCNFLFCTTHSPFIFDNELIANTTDLSFYTTER